MTFCFFLSWISSSSLLSHAHPRAQCTILKCIISMRAYYINIITRGGKKSRVNLYTTVCTVSFLDSAVEAEGRKYGKTS